MFAATTTVTLTASRSWASDTFVGTLSTTGAFDLALGGQAFSGVLTHAGRLLTLSGTGTYTGVINLNAGALEVVSADSTVQSTVNAFASTNVTLTNGTWTGVVNTRNRNVLVTAAATFGGTITQSAGGSLVLAGPGPFTSAISLAGGGASALRLVSGCQLTGAVTLSANSAVIIEPGVLTTSTLTSGAFNMTVNLLSGTYDGLITQSNGGTLLLTGAGNFTGRISITGAAPGGAPLTISGPAVTLISLSANSRVSVVSGSLGTVRIGRDLTLLNAVPVSLTVEDFPSSTVTLAGPASVSLSMQSTATVNKIINLQAGVILSGSLERTSGPLSVSLAAGAVFDADVLVASSVSSVSWTGTGAGALLGSSARIALGGSTSLSFTGVTLNSGVQILGGPPALSLTRVVISSGVSLPSAATFGTVCAERSEGKRGSIHFVLCVCQLSMRTAPWPLTRPVLLAFSATPALTCLSAPLHLLLL